MTSNGKDMILRDHLALDRTKLANERTLLAYMRTAIMLFVSGVTFIKIFIGEPIEVVLGYLLLSSSIVVGAVGVLRFRGMQAKMGEYYRPLEHDGAPKQENGPRA